MTYWGIADQYMRSLKFNRTYKKVVETEQVQDEIMIMKEFHASIGGMFIKYGKTKWLRDTPICHYPLFIIRKSNFIYHTPNQIAQALRD